MILTDREIGDITHDVVTNAHTLEYFARAIEAAILERIGEPVGVFANVNKLTPEHGERWEQMIPEAHDGVDYIYLYAIGMDE
jgi:hypothetical protein